VIAVHEAAAEILGFVAGIDLNSTYEEKDVVSVVLRSR
jgi:hypothetical protein